MKSIKLRLLLFIALTLSAGGSAALALTPEQIALVVNRRVPEGVELAQFYAQARGFPPDRVIERDLPTPVELPVDRYARGVTPPIRQFLRSHDLERKVSCLVTFYGVPLRISDRVNSLSDKLELARLREQAKAVSEQLTVLVVAVEKQAAELDGAFAPPTTERTFEALAQRAEHAGKTLSAAAERATDPQVRERLSRFMGDTTAKFSGPVDVPAVGTATAPASAPLGSSQPTTAPLGELLEQPYDPAARTALRELGANSAGIFGYARILQNQIDYLTTDATGAAVDNELALLWWPAYPRVRWQPNALNPHYRNLRTPPVVMVTRLDAPPPQMVRDLIANSVEVERYGLKGRLVVDSRGIAPRDQAGKNDAFGVFDDRLRALATFAHIKSNLQVTLDDKPEVIPPNSVDDVALYCGWYSVRNYVPGMKFNPGAVGYHVASFELVSLRGEREGGWVKGLLHAGVVATLGAVAEPYLHSFPAPDEFFPLLMTGKMTLAEVYWTTTPLVSWMQTCIGDPLYTPYARNPAVKIQDLPPRLQASFTETSQARPADGR